MSSVFFAFYERLKSDLARERGRQHQQLQVEELQQQRAQGQQQRRAALVASRPANAGAAAPHPQLLFDLRQPIHASMLPPMLVRGSC